jgi:hypothetical protein
MPEFSYLKTDPFTRINDTFVHNESIDASPINQSVRHPLITTPPNFMEDRFQPDFYQYIACDIVVETVFDYPYPYISEKTLRPISCKKMFIVVGPIGILSHLRSKGFQTFDDFINEKYDTIIDPNERFFAVVEQIRRFCDRPLHEIMQYLNDNKSKFDHNFENLMSLHDRELDELKRKIR